MSNQEDKPGLVGSADTQFLSRAYRYLEGELREEELSALEKDLASNVDQAEAFVQLCLIRGRLIEELQRRRHGEKDLVLLRSPDAEFSSGLANSLDDAMVLPAIQGVEEEAPIVAPLRLDEPPERIPNIPRRKRLPSFHLWVSIAALFVIAFGCVFLLMRRGTPSITLAGAVNATWDAPGATVKTGAAFPASEVRLNTGVVRLAYTNGAQVVIEAPARFETIAPNRISLLVGKLTAFVPTAAHGFTVASGGATIVDLGTEFGVDAYNDGSTDVDVFQGKVTVAPRQSGVNGQMELVKPLEVTAGTAQRVTSDGTIAEIKSDSTAYVRPQDFERLAASRDNSFDRWQAYSQRLRNDPSVIAYYTFDNALEAPDQLLNRSSSGAAMDGILGGDDKDARPTWTTGRWPGKGALTFDTSTPQHVELANSSALDFSGDGKTSKPFTICAWVRAIPIQGEMGCIICRGHGYAEQFAVEERYGRFSTWVRSIAAPKDSGFFVEDPLPAEGWHCVVSVYDPAKKFVAIYVDGKLGSQRAAAPILLKVDEPTEIGSRERGSDVFDTTFNGTIDELAIFNKPLSADAIREIYEAGKPN